MIYLTQLYAAHVVKVGLLILDHKCCTTCTDREKIKLMGISSIIAFVVCVRNLETISFNWQQNTWIG